MQDTTATAALLHYLTIHLLLWISPLRLFVLCTTLLACSVPIMRLITFLWWPPFTMELRYSLEYAQYRAHLPHGHWADGWRPSLFAGILFIVILLADSIAWIHSLEKRQEQQQQEQEEADEEMFLSYLLAPLWQPSLTAEFFHRYIYELSHMAIMLAASLVVYAHHSNCAINTIANSNANSTMDTNGNTEIAMRSPWSRCLCPTVIVLYSMFVVSLSTALFIRHPWLTLINTGHYTYTNQSYCIDLHINLNTNNHHHFAAAADADAIETTVEVTIGPGLWTDINTCTSTNVNNDVILDQHCQQRSSTSEEEAEEEETIDNDDNEDDQDEEQVTICETTI
ncbi:hypothetical protein BDF22DRAFT_664546 [Syncephalis plumigaleata]|nr:hypothetical protein BDF22DRAFT_664546 [Syncephalis plumigaleata]